MFPFSDPKALVPIVSAVLFLIAAALTFTFALYTQHPTPRYWRGGIWSIAGLLASVGVIRLASVVGTITPIEGPQYTAIALCAFTLLLAENVILCRVEHRARRQPGRLELSKK